MKLFIAGLVVYVVPLCFLWYTYLHPKIIVRDPDRPAVRIVNERSGTEERLTYDEDDLLISHHEIKLSRDWTKTVDWGRCRQINAVVVQAPKGAKTQISVYYEDVCI